MFSFVCFVYFLVRSIPLSRSRRSTTPAISRSTIRPFREGQNGLTAEDKNEPRNTRNTRKGRNFGHDPRLEHERIVR
jgi:hypothetical protein